MRGIRFGFALIALTSTLLATACSQQQPQTGANLFPGILTGSAATWVAGNRDANGIYRAKLQFDQAGHPTYLFIEVLDDDLFHVEFASYDGPDVNSSLYASPMVADTPYSGPTWVSHNGGQLETEEIRLDINEHGCIAVFDKSDSGYLSTVCPVNLRWPWKGISMEPSSMTHVYGLGQYFLKLGNANGDWTSHGRFRTDGNFGNNFRAFWGGANGQIQFPVMYAAGYGNDAFGLFLDNVYKQDWDFAGDKWWQVRMHGEQVRFYLMTGPDLLDIRSDYLELTGRPPVPPRKAFGLWISEFGFDNWGEIDDKLSGLRAARFPVDGAVLDLQWFGGAWHSSDDSPMGGLKWDRNSFPDPEQKLWDYAQDHVGIITIEESYVAEKWWGDMSGQKGLVHVCDTDHLTEFWNWMGHVAMIDWSKRSAAAWWHDNVRKPHIVDKGVIGHWTDLGEPERYHPKSCYRGVEPWKYQHGDIHNIYNLLWHQSIYEGYRRNQTAQRPFLLTRAGAPGIQRFGAAMWSGDIASRLDVLATHMNAAMHMSFAGLDYYSSDVGGFWRRVWWKDTNATNRDGMSPDTMYTQWFANSAWFDIPLRPHTFNCGFSWFRDDGCPYQISPARIGNPESNLQNLRQRYELIPYYYSLAHRAYLYGEPVIAPVVMHHQDDFNVREMGHQKLIGRDLLVGVVASHGEEYRSMYLPHGTWVNYHTNEWVESWGQWTGNVPIWRDGVFRLPVYARAGAILPMMFVDEQTKDAYGHRLDGSLHDELIVKVYADQDQTQFTLFEDDGATVAWYDEYGRPHYRTRTTEIRQQILGGQAQVTIAAAVGEGDDLPTIRNNEIRLVFQADRVSSVTMNGDLLEEVDQAACQMVESGYCYTGNGEIRIRTGHLTVDTEKTVVVTLD